MIGLIYIRKLYDMSMEDVAQKLGITKQTISKWEKQKIPISDKRLRQLSNLFNIPEKYFQEEASDLNKLYIQKIKLYNELDSDIFQKNIKIRDINEKDVNILKKRSLIDIKIKRNEIIEKMEKILQFENISDRVFINQILMYLQSVIKIIETSNFDEISLANSISMILLYYYEPDKYKKDVDISEFPDDYNKLFNNFNKSILQSIKNFSEANTDF